MTLDETVALFLECETRRSHARSAALSEGKSDDEARATAHEAAKAHWNAWAERMLAKRKALEEAATWKPHQVYPWVSEKGENPETQAWLEKAAADFSRCLFIVRGDGGSKDALGEKDNQPEAENAPVTSIAIAGETIDFRDFIFPGLTSFDKAAFQGDTSFVGAAFHDHVSFHCANFQYAGFAWTTFHGYTSFEWAALGDSSFASATFHDGAIFDCATFRGEVYLSGAAFNSLECGSVEFERTVNFGGANFRGSTWFDKTAFHGEASFEGASFCDTSFKGVAFHDRVSFERATFREEIIFLAIHVERAFSIAGAKFDAVPDFTQAHFEETPHLTNLKVIGRIIKPQAGLGCIKIGAATTEEYRRNSPSRWRALKHLAVRGHDAGLELEFHAREIRSQRFVNDWPLPLAFWSGDAWAGFFRFWFGLCYGITSDFGRSVFWPLFFWFVAIITFAAFYLSQTDMVQHDLALQEASYVGAAAQAGRYAISNTVPCYLPQDTSRSSQSGLGEKLRSQTKAQAEALHLAFRNSLIAIDVGGDASNRIYGCLFGFDGTTPIVPGTVSVASAIQKLFSGLMIFLFGLALRNMLKVR